MLRYVEKTHTKWYKSLTVKTLASGEGAGTIGVGDADDPIEWLVGEFEDGTYDIPYCETLTVHYTYAKEPEYLTTDPFDADPSMVAHLHSAIPEVPFGVEEGPDCVELCVGHVLLPTDVLPHLHHPRQFVEQHYISFGVECEALGGMFEEGVGEL